MRDYSAYRRFRGTGMRMLDLRLYDNDGALEEILRISSFGVTEPINDRMFRLINAFIANGGRYCLPEPLQPSRWTMKAAAGTATPRHLPDQPCQFALQAIVEPAKKRISSFEALIRSPTGGSPWKCLPPLRRRIVTVSTSRAKHMPSLSQVSYRSANTNWPLTCCPVRCITILTPSAG
jgi:hypothetical protein